MLIQHIVSGKKMNHIYEVKVLKYNNDEDCGIVDNKMVLDAEDDVATITMGSHWCIPTSTQAEELINETTQQWVENYNNSNVNGMLFTSNTNDNTIFLPANGITPITVGESGAIVDTPPQYVGELIYLWCSDIDEEDSLTAYVLSYYLKKNKKVLDVVTIDRARGMGIRGVYK